MKVIYRKPLLQRLIEAKYEAALQNREIEYFELTQAEWDELKRRLQAPMFTVAEEKNLLHVRKILGIEVRIVDA